MATAPSPPSRPFPGVVAWAARGTALGHIALLHGVTSSAGTWWRVGPALATSGWDVTALDLPGHGEGPRLPAGPADLGTLVEGVVPLLPPELTVLVGHSLGAIVSLSVADRYPGVARGLLLEDPPGTTGADAGQIADGIEAVAMAVRADRETFWQGVRQANPGWTDAEVEGSVAALEVTDTAAVARALRSGVTWDLPELVASVQAQLPVLVVAGRPEEGAHPASGGSALVGHDREAVRRLVTEARFVELGGGHSLHRAHPDRMAEIIAGFAASLLSQN
jgi:3-oxoadipate enol-lactonase